MFRADLLLPDILIGAASNNILPYPLQMTLNFVNSGHN